MSIKEFVMLLENIGYKIDKDIGLFQFKPLIFPDNYKDVLRSLYQNGLLKLYTILMIILCVNKVSIKFTKSKSKSTNRAEILLGHSGLGYGENVIPYLNLSEAIALKNINSEIKDAITRIQYDSTSQTHSKKYNFIDSFKGLSYKGNSCYIDSTLLCLLLVPNSIIEKYMFVDLKKRGQELPSLKEQLIPTNPNLFYLKSLLFSCKFDSTPEKNLKYLLAIQTELKNIANSYHQEEPKNCEKLRELLKKCDCDEKSQFFLPIPQDAGEFLQFLFKLFNMDTIYKQKRYTYGSNKRDRNFKLTSEINTLVSPIITIPITNLKESHCITEFIIKKEISEMDGWNTGYKYKLELEKLIAKDLVIFYVCRTDKKRFVKTELFPTETLFLSDYSHLKLSGIVVHHENFAHYTAVVKYNQIWYYYNDMKSIEKIGSFRDMLKTKPSPITHGTLYFYS